MGSISTIGLILFGFSLHKRESCPSNGQRRDNCDCILIGPDRSGFTVFWKVRLNITSLQIITNDFTFSRQIKGKQIPYGTAGDCYSAQEGCIQGTLSIDLTETSFRLSRSVRWIHNGNRASSQIDVREQVVRGKCGGFCGSCMPDPNVGLAVEVT
ncbi:hypothetical protein ILUMI_10850 [Ignelater luminosus]|uniref:GON domain-containing protein n=1 Tax=Ignelater luminosus TaxID=2038154 RepID=A0A8K0D1L1_IGNLU|nr:hypothetical protein ILUMI_10850 [Ignelater luminosus]